MQKKSKFNVFTFMMLIILGLTFQPAISTYAACPDSISSYWKLDEAAGPTYSDFISDNNGTGSADPAATTDGIVNGAQQFDGANSGIDVAADSSFNWLENESFSIEFWVKRNGGIGVGASSEIAIGRDATIDPDNSLHWWVGIRGNDVNTAVFVLGDNDGGNVKSVPGAKVITDNIWHHVVAVRDGENGLNLLYVDGVLDVPAVPADYDSGFDSSTAKLNIGYLNLNPFFRLNGFLDEVALYNTALTAAEIQKHYTDGRAGKGIETSRPAPVAVADADPTNPKETTVVTLDGTGSTPGYVGVDAAIASYLWEQLPGGTQVTLTNPATDMATFTAPDVAAAGMDLTFQLTVTAEDGQSSDPPATVIVSVVDVAAPVANAGVDQNIAEGNPVTLDGSGSTGSNITFAWTPSSGTGWALSDATAESPTFTAPDVAVGGETLTFQLTVTDDIGRKSAPATVDVNVADATASPVADAGPDQDVTVGDLVTLDGTGSTGTGLTYAWEQVIVADESRVQLADADKATATFTAPDASAVAAALLETLTFKLTVTDNANITSTATTNVNVDDGRSSGGGGGGGGGGGCFINSMF